MEEENVSRPYSTQEETRSLFNNPKRSDVRFLVDGQTVYGHKFALSMGSPVFDRMFFGELKEKREVIEIEDLSFIGFMNALRYIYGFKIDHGLTELYESYLAADKYLLHHFSEAFFDYIQGKLNAKSSCLIYDQLMKIGEREEIPLASVRRMIIENSAKTIQSDHFSQIDRETLISLLSLDELSIDEIDLVAAVSKWVDCEVQRQDLPVNRENRLQVFEPIKGYILFTALTPEKIANCKEVVELLTVEERGSLALYLLDKNNPSMIKLQTQRRAEKLVHCIVFCNSIPAFSESPFSRSVNLSVNREVRLFTIHSTYSKSAENLSFKILDSNGVDLDLKIERFVNEGKWSFWCDPPFDVQPNRSYTLQVTADGKATRDDHQSDQLQLNYKAFVVFNLCPCSDHDYHFVKGLEFWASD